MGLYIGSTGKRKVYMDGIVYRLNLYSTAPNTNGVRLISFDGLALTDSNGNYLTVGDDGFDDTSITTSDG